MREYAVDQERFIRDFVSVFDKMLANGYNRLSAGPDQTTGKENKKEGKACLDLTCLS